MSAMQLDGALNSDRFRANQGEPINRLLMADPRLSVWIWTVGRAQPFPVSSHPNSAPLD